MKKCSKCKLEKEECYFSFKNKENIIVDGATKIRHKV